MFHEYEAGPQLEASSYSCGELEAIESAEWLPSPSPASPTVRRSRLSMPGFAASSKASQGPERVAAASHPGSPFSSRR